MENMNKYVDMEAMKAKYAEESPDEQQSRKRKLLFPAFINFAVGIAMVVVGAVYNDQDQIGSATDFLMVCNLLKSSFKVYKVELMKLSWVINGWCYRNG